MSNHSSVSATNHHPVPTHHGASQYASLSTQPRRPITVDSPDTAAAHLRGALSREEVIDAIFDIVASLLGSDEAALYVVEWDFSTLRLVGSRGVGPQILLNMRASLIGSVAFSGKEYVAETPVPQSGAATDERLTFCIPFIYGGVSTFVLAVYGIGPHKDRLEERDFKVIQFFKDHAAAALNRAAK